MKLTTFAGAAAAAALTVALGAPMANAADARTNTTAAPSMASECYWTHHWDGFWHPRARLVCDHDEGYDGNYYGHDRGFREHGEHSFRNHEGTERGTTERGTTSGADRSAGTSSGAGRSGGSTGAGTTGGGTTGGGTMPGGR